MQIYISRNGKQLGVFEENAVLQMLQNGQLLPNDLGVKQGDAQWQPLGRMFPNSSPTLNAVQFPQPVQNNFQTPVMPAKSGSSKGCLFAVIGLAALFLLTAVGFVGYLFSRSSTKVYQTPPANKPVNSSTPVPQDLTAMKNIAEDLAKLSPSVKLDSKAKLKGKIAIVEKGKYAAELKGYDAYFKETTDLTGYNLTKDMIAKTPDEIDSLVQIICTKGKMIGRYEGNITGYANNCKVSMIDYRSKIVFAQKMLINSEPEKSVSSVYDNGEYIVIPPIFEIENYIKSFVPPKTKVSPTEKSSLSNMEIEEYLKPFRKV